MNNHFARRLVPFCVRLLVLDEAQVYDSVFRMNEAFFLRRLQVASSAHQLICSTATLGKPQDFIFQLTGRHTMAFGPDSDGARISRKDIILARADSGDTFESTARFVRSLARSFLGRFLVLGDSRKGVQILTAASRPQEGEKGEADTNPDLDIGVLPFPAGCEVEDRRRRRDALTSGQLRGVVSTSALELDLDIGDNDLVVLLDAPPLARSFWQRVGRVRRRSPGICVLIDSRRAIGDGQEALTSLKVVRVTMKRRSPVAGLPEINNPQVQPQSGESENAN